MGQLLLTEKLPSTMWYWRKDRSDEKRRKKT